MLGKIDPEGTKSKHSLIKLLAFKGKKILKHSSIRHTKWKEH